MTKKELIKNEIWIIWKIYILCKECFNYTYYLHKPDTKEEFKYLARDPDFKFIRHILWRMMIIELSKLLSKSERRDKYNLLNLLTKLGKQGFYGDTSVTKETLSRWQTALESNDELIQEILLLRDKFYAHTDNNSDGSTEITISFREIKDLLLIIEDIIKEIHHQVLNREAMVEDVIFDKEHFDIIKILSADQKRKDIELAKS